MQRVGWFWVVILNVSLVFYKSDFDLSAYLTYIRTVTYYDKGYQQMPLSFVIFLYYTSLPYMFRASISPSSGVSPAVAYLLPLGSYSAWPFVRVRLGLWAVSMWPHRNSPQTQTHADKRPSTIWIKWQQISNSWGYPWWWADRGPKHVG